MVSLNGLMTQCVSENTLKIREEASVLIVGTTLENGALAIVGKSTRQRQMKVEVLRNRVEKSTEKFVKISLPVRTKIHCHFFYVRKMCDFLMLTSVQFLSAFRFFFLEYFNSSMEAWHTARTAYTRSCAVNSIVGHILGIGGRHTSNILVHTKTGEVVHIDFGFVFEQGKTLTIPELVPFRLTRDIVDGMGPSGTDGVFFKAAEATLGVLRNNSDTLLTILSAVVSDPLYKWSISPQKARELQQEQNIKEEDGEDECKSKEGSSRSSLVDFNAEDDENRNDAAARAISKITNKLQGYEDSSSVDKSVAGQVKLLINEARDPDNLALMFVGWSSWL